MEKRQFAIWENSEYSNPIPGEFVPNIMAYLHSDSEKTDRGAILVVPGGGYRMTACAEGEIVAEKFFQKGYNTFVLTYTTALFTDVSLKLQPLKDIARAVLFLRKNAESFHISPDRVTLCGFSAGGHLCASLAVHWNDVRICPEAAGNPRICRPDAVILSYPVITADRPYAHEDSFRVLLGSDCTPEEQDYFSVEKHVSGDTPPAFLWHTATDETVPVENSMLYWKACRKYAVPSALHIFSDGPHGYSLADERWASGTYEGDYTMDQWFAYMQYYIDRGEPIPAPFHELHLPRGTSYREYYRTGPKDFLKGTANEEVAVWPDLADQWLKKIMQKEAGVSAQESEDAEWEI